MPEDEPITVEHFAKGIVKPKTGIKALAFLPWLLLFVFIGYSVYKAYFKKPEPTQDIETVEEMNVYNAPKRHLILFAEPYVFVDTEENSGLGIRAGIRWEF